MKKIVFAVLSLLVISMFLVGCAEKELTKEEERALEVELEQMSDEELDSVIQEGESEDTKALAGQAYRRVSVGRYNYKPSRALKSAYKVKSERTIQRLPGTVDLTKTITLQNRTIIKLNQTLLNYTKTIGEQNKTIVRLNQTLLNYTRIIALQNLTITRLNLTLLNYTNQTNSS